MAPGVETTLLVTLDVVSISMLGWVIKRIFSLEYRTGRIEAKVDKVNSCLNEEE